MTSLVAPRKTVVSQSTLRIALVGAGEIFGGVEQFLFSYGHHLITRTKHSVLVVLTHEGPLARRLRADGVDSRVLPSAGRYDLRQVARLRSLLHHFNPDVIHAHGYKAAFLTGLAARGLRAVLVKTEHGAVEPRRGRERLKMSVNDRLDRWVTRARFHGVVYVTENLKKARGVRGRLATIVIPNGVSLHASPSRTLGRAAAPDRFNVAVVGRLSAVKGHRFLFEAIGRIEADRRPVVHVMGTGPLEPELRALARRLDILASVRFHGFVSDVEAVLPEMDAIVMPSVNEGLPYVLLEAMRAGRPVVASNVGGVPEVLQDGECGLLVPAGDAASLARALERLRDDEKLKDRLGRAARSRLKQKFTLSRMAASYESFYRSLRRAS